MTKTNASINEIKVTWANSIEWLPDLNPSISTIGQIETVEIPNGTAETLVLYPWVSIDGPCVQLTYNKVDHPELADSGYDSWGVAEYDYSNSCSPPTVSWKHYLGIADGSATVAVISSDRLAVTVESSSRQQSQLKRMLIRIDGCCVVTKERVEAALECAHIIPVQDSRSNDSIHNAILLRADIHRLFDRKLISIDLDGKVEIDDSLAKSNYAELSSVKIPTPTLKRITKRLNEKRRLR